MMTEPEAKFYQECEFCHKLVETDEHGLPVVKLPARYICADGTQDGLTSETASICKVCCERLYEHLSKVLELTHIEYSGTVIHWLDDVMDEDVATNEN